MRKRFWKRIALADMTNEEWEALCDGCGKCCLLKLENEDTGEVHYTNVACRLFDADTRRCGNYALRRQLVNDIYGVVQLNRVKGGVKGYFEVLDPDRAKREDEEAAERTRKNAEAAAYEAEKAKQREVEDQARMAQHQNNDGF